jgi:hypothetical protein
MKMLKGDFPSHFVILSKGNAMPVCPLIQQIALAVDCHWNHGTLSKKRSIDCHFRVLRQAGLH